MYFTIRLTFVQISSLYLHSKYDQFQVSSYSSSTQSFSSCTVLPSLFAVEDLTVKYGNNWKSPIFFPSKNMYDSQHMVQKNAFLTGNRSLFTTSQQACLWQQMKHRKWEGRFIEISLGYLKSIKHKNNLGHFREVIFGWTVREYVLFGYQTVSALYKFYIRNTNYMFTVALMNVNITISQARFQGFKCHLKANYVPIKLIIFDDCRIEDDYDNTIVRDFPK